jgi:hypothetical protein
MKTQLKAEVKNQGFRWTALIVVMIACGGRSDIPHRLPRAAVGELRWRGQRHEQ